MWQAMRAALIQGNTKALARALSLVENEAAGYDGFLENLPAHTTTPVVGITGPPGAGKSTLTDALIGEYMAEGLRVAVLCVDPSSPFNRGAVLGDRIRMSNWYTHPAVFIRSLASRGSVGGLSPKIIELVSVLQAAPFDVILIETVGVGQSEIEIAGLADITVVVLVPEGGDAVQTMKAGLMEVADVFVVNKADRPGADAFVQSLRQMLAPAFRQRPNIPILKTEAAQQAGIAHLHGILKKIAHAPQQNEKRLALRTEKAWQLLQQQRMQGISRQALTAALQQVPDENLYRFVKKYL